MLADAAATSTIGQATLMPEGEPTVEITTAELRQILAEQSAYLFDARAYLEYAISHIPGSLTVTARLWEASTQVGASVAAIEKAVPNKQAAIVIYGNGPHCEQSKGLTDALLVAGFRNVRRYQLGIPIWRALGGVTQMEVAGARYVLTHDQTALWIDARQSAEFVAGSLARAINLNSKAAVVQDHQWLMRQDHNTHLIVFGEDEGQVRGVAGEMARLAFHNVSYVVGSAEAIASVVTNRTCGNYTRNGNGFRCKSEG